MTIAAVEEHGVERFVEELPRLRFAGEHLLRDPRLSTFPRQLLPVRRAACADAWGFHVGRCAVNDRPCAGHVAHAAVHVGCCAGHVARGAVHVGRRRSAVARGPALVRRRPARVRRRPALVRRSSLLVRRSPALVRRSSVLVTERAARSPKKRRRALPSRERVEGKLPAAISFSSAVSSASTLVFVIVVCALAS